MSPLSFIRFVLALFLCAGVAQAQTNALDSEKVILTVINKSDLELLLNLGLMPTSIAAPLPPPSSVPGLTPNPTAPPVRNRVTEFRIGQTVLPQQQTVLQIPKGTYMVEAGAPLSPTPSPAQPDVRRYLRVSSSHEFNDIVATNEVWTFELENGPGASLDPKDRIQQWKRNVQPARPLRSSDPAGLRTIPERTHRLAPGDVQPPESLRSIPTRTLKLAPNAPPP